MQFESSINVSAPAEKIFSVYAAVSQWPTWDLEVESASLDGDFVLGGTGKVKPKGAPETKITITELTHNKSVTTVCQLPLCTMHFVHILNAQSDGSTQVINQLNFTGLLTPVEEKHFLP